MSKAEIFYKDIGDYLSREEKLKRVREDRSILNPALLAGMERITPNEQGDWINKRNSKFEEFIPLEPEKKFDEKAQTFFIGTKKSKNPKPIYSKTQNPMGGGA